MKNPRPRLRIVLVYLISLSAAVWLFAFAFVPADAQGLPDTGSSGGIYNPLSSHSNDQQSNLLTQPTLSPGTVFLFNLEAKFAADVAAGGGTAFASWFAEDGVTLANGKAPVVGRTAIAAQAVWSPKDYQLTWSPQGGQLSAQGDMGFTFGHYEGRSKDAQGNPVVVSGRYFTVWKKQSNGDWKVAVDASQEEPSNDCCSLKNP